MLTVLLKKIRGRGVMCPSKIGDARGTTVFFPMGFLRALKMQVCFLAERKGAPFLSVEKGRTNLQYPLSVPPANSKRKGLGWGVGMLRAEAGPGGLSDGLTPVPFSSRKKRPDPVSLGPGPGKGACLRAAYGMGPESEVSPSGPLSSLPRPRS